MKVDVTYPILLIIALVAVLCTKKPQGVSPVVVSDTVVVEKTDSIIIEKPVEVVRYVARYKTDTLTTVDSVMVAVQVPIEQTIYEDTIPNGRYKAYISGYDAALDSLEIDVKHTDHYITTTTYIPPKRWSFGVTGGIMAGYDPFRNQITSGIGLTLGLQYNFRTKKFYKRYGQ